jgi:superfamily II DNA/RNA helicase
VLACPTHGRQACLLVLVSHIKDGNFRVLVATDVAARGIHVEDIAHVVNYDLPQIPEDFIHRVGRTGHAGARGSSWTFATPLERSDIRGIEKMFNVRIEDQDVPSLPPPIGMVPDDGIIVPTLQSAPRPQWLCRRRAKCALLRPAAAADVDPPKIAFDITK